MGRFVYSVFSEHYRFIGGKVALFYGMFFLFNVTLLWFVHRLLPRKQSFPYPQNGRLYF
jgi:hypothetical protein